MATFLYRTKQNSVCIRQSHVMFPTFHYLCTCIMVVFMTLCLPLLLPLLLRIRYRILRGSCHTPALNIHGSRRYHQLSHYGLPLMIRTRWRHYNCMVIKQHCHHLFQHGILCDNYEFPPITIQISEEAPERLNNLYLISFPFCINLLCVCPRLQNIHQHIQQYCMLIHPWSLCHSTLDLLNILHYQHRSSKNLQKKEPVDLILDVLWDMSCSVSDVLLCYLGCLPPQSYWSSVGSRSPLHSSHT